MSLVEQNPFRHCRKFKGKHLHLGVTGSIAAYKICDVLRAWLGCEINVSATLTEGAKKFVTPMLFHGLGAFPVYENLFDDGENIFQHLEPSQIGGAFVIAPASADFMARAVSGRCDDLLACQVLAFDGPIAIAPAMNPRMWQNPITQENVASLKRYGWKIILPESGRTACGDIGSGRLAASQEIFLTGLTLLTPQDMQGLNVMVTLGPTREYWDCARFWSNPSSGAMGTALATAAWLRGANVTAIVGPGVQFQLPENIEKILVESAAEMFEASRACWPKMDWGIFCAAVADFHVKNCSREKKIKKSSLANAFSLAMEANPDILATLASQKKKDQKILGFAAEACESSDALADLALQKLKAKNADIIAANLVTGPQGAFGNEKSCLVTVDKTGRKESWDAQSKADSAWELCSWLLRM